MTTLLLHGLGADSAQPLGLFSPVLDALGHDDVSAPDVRAHGTAAHPLGTPADYALDRLADDVLSRVGTLDGPVTLIGISMGAALALRIALRRLVPIERAIFVRPAFGSMPLADNLAPFPVIGELLRSRGPVEGARVFRQSEAYHRIELASPAGGRGLLSQFRATDATGRSIRLIEVPRNRAYASSAELTGLADVATAVIGAPRDPVHPFALAEEWAGGLGAPLERLPARDDGLAAQTEALRTFVARHLA
ncbi:alpha/beta hydrolase [Agromyces atrinae]|uniref:alpha/beta fold hydrolase n=1 Tax=Agromyces atrinae TaxID=592376 RepID=UPI001F565430|nr:alpha/beta hydrolase [Agromyces atrinae]MCI2957467.1 alpha/beta hydrolase [Agromyces atrinae]